MIEQDKENFDKNTHFKLKYCNLGLIFVIKTNGNDGQNGKKNKTKFGINKKFLSLVCLVFESAPHLLSGGRRQQCSTEGVSLV